MQSVHAVQVEMIYYLHTELFDNDCIYKSYEQNEVCSVQ